ncbi:1,4-alpha-glucan branching protein GlgB [Collinsella sp. zg1085]|uniref:1,4-alpha-glucan branching protein GlgB n=1 Tax=Collinsella sp. zg1085 TaxID=2844380 RepID=UPI001C0C8EBC|nr:1,4-alpha-glucan branching protein GlgB [Collinsella sp. zg1085]QWT17135.1 1,4-alpha-glucan branching protein GlgB [Collinsella sp. zg1085]
MSSASRLYTSLDFLITDDDIHLLKEGSWFHAWKKMGAHPVIYEGESAWCFRVLAPRVSAVEVVGSWNTWQRGAYPMQELGESGIWECIIPNLSQGELYKYVITTRAGDTLYKADPFAFYAEKTPGTASRLFDLAGYNWHDQPWQEALTHKHLLEQPLNIYEVHLGSWKRHGSEPQGEPRADGTYPGPGDPFPAQRGRMYSYTELADDLIAYAKDMGYTHLELMPLNEHPFDGSWGYQATGYYAATARYGNPHELMALIDAAHAAGIGIIIDWVPGHFCADEQGLARFTGNFFYEREIHPNWGTHKVDFGRGEVVSFFGSNALYWAEVFHVDGIRVDGVSSMLYLNFGIDNPADKKWNHLGTEEDLDASRFLRKVNTIMGREHPQVLMIAEESTAWPLVTYPPEDGGLGFHLKWDMGWMNDTLHYMQTDFPWRPGNHGLLTFSLMYAFNENFVLPLSHDEVVNGKCSLIQRMPGDQWRQFAGLRSLYLYQMTHPGAKLNFMGNEIGQYIEWRYYESIEWFLSENFPLHAGIQCATKELNHLYRQERALWEQAYSSAGYEWIEPDDGARSIISFIRRAKHRRDDLVVIINFTPSYYESFELVVPEGGTWKEIYNSDDERYGGSGKLNSEHLHATIAARTKPNACNTSHEVDETLAEDKQGTEQRSCKPALKTEDMQALLTLKLPPLGGVILKRIAEKSHINKSKQTKKG